MCRWNWNIKQTVRSTNSDSVWPAVVSFSCRHPTRPSVPSEVTFSTYLPRHMMSGQGGRGWVWGLSNQEDEMRAHYGHSQSLVAFQVYGKAMFRQDTEIPQQEAYML